MSRTLLSREAFRFHAGLRYLGQIMNLTDPAIRDPPFDWTPVERHDCAIKHHRWQVWWKADDASNSLQGNRRGDALVRSAEQNGVLRSKNAYLVDVRPL